MKDEGLEEKKILQVESLVCGYLKNTVINDITFTLNPGDFCGILGPNGAGKTTLLRVIGKLLNPLAGRILLQNKEIRNIPINDYARLVAVVPQFTEFNFTFTVEEFIWLGRTPYLNWFTVAKETDRKVVYEIMKLLEIEDLKSRYIKQLSGGERQRVFIAQALVQEPKLLLLDEPVAHLDIKHQIDILDLLQQLNRKGLTLVVVLHDLNLAAEYCNRIILLDKGRINCTGSPEQVVKYHIIEQVYHTLVVVEKNPVSGKPLVIPVPGEFKHLNTK